MSPPAEQSAAGRATRRSVGGAGSPRPRGGPRVHRVQPDRAVGDPDDRASALRRRGPRRRPAGGAASRWAVGSSRTSTGWSASSERATARRARSPPDTWACPSPSRVSRPSGSPSQPRPEAGLPRARPRTSSSAASGRASRTFSASVVANTCGSSSTSPTWRRTSSRASAGQVGAAEADRPPSRVDEAQQQRGQRALAGAGRADHADALARRAGRATGPGARRPSPQPAVTRARAAVPSGAAQGRAAGRAGSVTAGSASTAPPGLARPRPCGPPACPRPAAGHDLGQGERQQHEQRRQRRRRRARGAARHGDGHHARRRRRAGERPRPGGDRAGRRDAWPPASVAAGGATRRAPARRPAT